MPNTTKRSASLSSLCARLERVVHGRTAKTILESLPDNDELAIATLPVWCWRPSGIPMGRKDRAVDGQRMLMPIRVAWNTEPVLVIEPAQPTPLRLPWTAKGLGLNERGTVEITTASFSTGREPNPINVPDRFTVEQLPRARAKGELAALVEDGNLARWEILTWLESKIERALFRAHTSLMYEVAKTESLGRPRQHHSAAPDILVDLTTMEALRTELTYGADDGPEPSPMVRLLEKCLQEAAFRRVEPSRLVEQKVKQAAAGGLRRRLDDPDLGSKVRRLAIELGTRDEAVLLKVYRERYPSDHMGARRVAKAMSLMPATPEARSGCLHENTGASEPVWDLAAVFGGA